MPNCLLGLTHNNRQSCNHIAHSVFCKTLPGSAAAEQPAPYVSAPWQSDAGRLTDQVFAQIHHLLPSLYPVKLTGEMDSLKKGICRSGWRTATLNATWQWAQLWRMTNYSSFLSAGAWTVGENQRNQSPLPQVFYQVNSNSVVAEQPHSMPRLLRDALFVQLFVENFTSTKGPKRSKYG